jgi:hypothetical protein
MRCLICEAEWGHLPGCELGQLEEQTAGWDPAILSANTDLTWDPVLPSWLLETTFDPDHILPVANGASSMEVDLLGDACDVMREIACETREGRDIPVITTQASNNLRSWLEGSPVASVNNGNVNQTGELHMPEAWAALRTGVNALASGEETRVESVSGVREDEDLVREIDWDLMRCDETSVEEARPGVWPSAEEIADELLGLDRNEPNVRGNPVVNVVAPMPHESSVVELGRIRFLEAPASPTEEEQEGLDNGERPMGAFRPIQAVRGTGRYDVVRPDVRDDREPATRDVGTDMESVGVVGDLEESPEEGREVYPSPIQRHWTRTQARRSRRVDRRSDRVAHMRPAPRRDEGPYAIFHRRDPRVFRVRTTGPVIHTTDIISRVTSPCGSVMEERLGDHVHMARDKATQVPRKKKRSMAIQVHMRTESQAVSTQTVARLIEAMTLDTAPEVENEVIIRLLPAEGQDQVGVLPYSDVSSEGTTGDGAVADESCSSSGTPVQDERE